MEACDLAYVSRGAAPPRAVRGHVGHGFTSGVLRRPILVC